MKHVSTRNWRVLHVQAITATVRHLWDQATRRRFSPLQSRHHVRHVCWRDGAVRSLPQEHSGNRRNWTWTWSRRCSWQNFKGSLSGDCTSALGLVLFEISGDGWIKCFWLTPFCVREVGQWVLVACTMKCWVTQQTCTHGHNTTTERHKMWYTFWPDKRTLPEIHISPSRRLSFVMRIFLFHFRPSYLHFQKSRSILYLCYFYVCVDCRFSFLCKMIFSWKSDYP